MEPAGYLKLLLGLVSIVNPIGAIPVFLGLTQARGRAERQSIARQTSVAVFVILAIALVGGEAVLRFFGIGIASFRVAGGILVFLMALSMLRAEPSGLRQTPEEGLESSQRDSIAVVPLAMPMLAGPGAVSTVIVYAHSSPSWRHVGLVGLAIAGTALVTYGALRFAPVIEEMLGQTGMNVVTRVMGLILAAIAVELMAGGVQELLRPL